MRCEHELERRGMLDGLGRYCQGELKRVGSMDVIPRSAAVVHSRGDDLPEPPRVQTWAVYRCKHDHETRVLTDADGVTERRP